MRKTRVMIIDDSALVRHVLTQILQSDPSVEVIATAADPVFAERIMAKDWPDVIVLDVEMPRMDGITFLRKLMSEHTTPVVMCSSLTEEGAETTMAALAAGAVGVITKPKTGLKDFLNESALALIEAVKSAAHANLGSFRGPAASPPAPPPVAAHAGVAHLASEIRAKNSADVILPPAREGLVIPDTTEKVIAIGASTGGTQALESILTKLQPDCWGIVIVQHMPEKFTAAFASRLNSLCKIEVKEAEDGDAIVRGRAIIAPGNHHLVIKRNGASYAVSVLEGPVVNRHRPSVDVLFRSAARECGRNVLGVILTGMGDDGAEGMYEMHQAGAHTIAQDEASCIVFGMPKEAIKRGGVDEVSPLDKIAGHITAFKPS